MPGQLLAALAAVDEAALGARLAVLVPGEPQARALAQAVAALADQRARLAPLAPVPAAAIARNLRVVLELVRGARRFARAEVAERLQPAVAPVEAPDALREQAPAVGGHECADVARLLRARIGDRGVLECGLRARSERAEQACQTCPDPCVPGHRSRADLPVRRAISWRQDRRPAGRNWNRGRGKNFPAAAGARAQRFSKSALLRRPARCRCQLPKVASVWNA